MIGGLGVGAAVHYYQELAKMHAARRRVLNLVMAHADMARVRGAVEAGDKPASRPISPILSVACKLPARSSLWFPPLRRTSRSTS
jgi:hypothetical protein